MKQKTSKSCGVIIRIRTYFSKRKIQKDKKKNGHWSDLVIDRKTGKCLTEKEYINKYGSVLSDNEAKEIASKLLGIKKPLPISG
jgi:hypothetical protein